MLSYRFSIQTPHTFFRTLLLCDSKNKNKQLLPYTPLTEEYSLRRRKVFLAETGIFNTYSYFKLSEGLPTEPTNQHLVFGTTSVNNIPKCPQNVCKPPRESNR
jgi:hypothetical protein